MDLPIKAACPCGRLTFSSSAPPVVQFHCHCEDCRAATGAAFTRTAIFNTQGTERTGDVTRHTFTAHSGSTTFRDACSACGAIMFDISEQYPDLIGVLAECLQPPFEFQAAHHIWLQSRVTDVTLDDRLRQHQRGLFEG